MFKKKYLVLILALVLAILPFQAYSSSLKYIMLKINSKTAYVNMRPVQLDVAPIEINGRTLVPLRFIAEHFGAKNITYYPETEEISLELEDASVLRMEISKLNELVSSLKNEQTQLLEEIDALKKRIKELENQQAPEKPIVEAPKAPSDFSGYVSNNEAILTWKASVPGTFPVSGYKLYKKDNTHGVFTLESIIPAPSLVFVDRFVVEGGGYTYYLKAYDNQNPANESLDSKQIIILVPKSQPPSTPPPPPSNGNIGKTRNNPIPFGQTFLTPEGFQITVTKLTKGQEAWEILKEENQFNDPPEKGMQYVFVTVKVKNVSSKEEPAYVSELYASFVGSSNKIFNSYDKSAVQPSEGIYADLHAKLFHGGETTGSIVFYIPTTETNMRLIWNYSLFDNEKNIYFEVK